MSEAEAAAAEGEVPAGAVIARADGSIVARARNRVIALRDPTAHAEILAIREASRILSNYRLEGLVLAATLEPCAMCLAACLHARLRAVIFGAPEPKWGAAGSLLDLSSVPGLNHRLELLEGGVLAAECADAIKAFFRGIRKAAASSVEGGAERKRPGLPGPG
ncbi:MAG: nucleoside deaminase [Deltaproteobacteria bacterium]|nr:nucleoside deaminase [Deltaproteobacteria bacterium]